MAKEFDHFEFLMLCNHYPIDLDKVDEMLEDDIDFSKACFDKNHDFLSELMEYIEEGRLKACYDGNDKADDKYLYEVLKRIFEKGYVFPKDNNETLDECLDQLYYSNRDDYFPEVLKMFLNNGADVEHIINDEEESEDNIFTLAQIGMNIGFPENSVFEDIMWSTTYEILCAARKGQPYDCIHSVEWCVGQKIEEIYCGCGLKVHSKTDDYCSTPNRFQYRIKFTNGQQLIVNYVPETFMNSYDETYLAGKVMKLNGDYMKQEIISVRTFMQPNQMGHWHLYNMWLYLENGYILKFFDTEGEEHNNNLMLVCDKEDRK